MRKAVIYASKMGNTRSVAEHIAAGVGADLIDLKKQKDPDLSGYDAIVIGSGVYAGNPSRRVKVFAEDHAAELTSKDVALFLCCLFDDAKGDEQLAKIASAMPFVSQSTYFPGKMKDEKIKALIDRFILQLS